jgi:hypothetical protein
MHSSFKKRLNILQFNKLVLFFPASKRDNADNPLTRMRQGHFTIKAFPEILK